MCDTYGHMFENSSEQNGLDGAADENLLIGKRAR